MMAVEKEAGVNRLSFATDGEYQSIPTLCHCIWLVVSTMVSTMFQLPGSYINHEWVPPKSDCLKSPFPMKNGQRGLFWGASSPLVTTGHHRYVELSIYIYIIYIIYTYYIYIHDNVQNYDIVLYI
jgi:hypothetical protein